MDWQGKINFHKPITINDKPHGVEHENTLPAWTSGDNGRVVHAEDTGILWFGTSTEWVELTPGGIGTHDHDDRYYTETEIDGFFDGENGGKKTINYTNVQNKPTTFPPEAHNHNDLYYTETEVDSLISAIDIDAATFEKLDSGGDVGSGADQLAPGNHIHTAAAITYDNTVSSLTATDVKSAIDELSVEKGVEFTDTLFVAKNGNDSNDGSMDNPFLTVQAAVTAAGALGTYAVVFVYPGTYEEDLTLLPYVCIYAFGKEPTRIGTNSGTHTLIFSGNGRTFYSGVNFRLNTFNITHAPGAGGSISVWFEDCSAGEITVNGLGWNDYIQFRGSIYLYDKLTVHSAHLTWFNGESQVTLGSGDIQIEVDDDGAEAWDTLSGQACTCTLRDIEIENKLLFEGKVTASLYNCGVYNTITANGADTIVNYDNSSTPANRADLIALNSATFMRLDEAYAIDYNNTSSGIAADNIQDAIDEVQANITAVNAEAATFEALDAVGDIGTLADQVARGDHNHDTDYYTKLEFSAGQLDGRYYTETEINNILTSYSLDSHVHTALDITYDNSTSGLAAINVENAIDEVHVNRNILPLTSGVPLTSPAIGTTEFDESTNTLYIYNGTTWVFTTLV